MEQVIAIISSVLAGLSVAIAFYFFKNTYKRLLYKGVMLGGKWIGEVDFGKNQHVRLTLESYASNVKGILEAADTGTERVRSYDLKGIINGPYVSISFSARDPASYETGQIMLRMSADGMSLEGVLTAISFSGEIVSQPIALKRA